LRRCRCGAHTEIQKPAAQPRLVRSQTHSPGPSRLDTKYRGSLYLQDRGVRGPVLGTPGSSDKSCNESTALDVDWRAYDACVREVGLARRPIRPRFSKTKQRIPGAVGSATVSAASGSPVITDASSAANSGARPSNAGAPFPRLSEEGYGKRG